MKDNGQTTLANYDGRARPGEIVADLTTDPPTPYIGNNQGQLTLLTSAGSYGNTQVAQFLDAGLVGNITPAGNGVHSLGNSTNYWADLWVAGNTLYIGGVPVGVTGNTLTVNGSPVGGGLPLANGTSNIDIATANGNVTVSANTATWNFGTDSVLTVPGNTVTSTLYTDNNGYRLNLEGNNGGVNTAKLVLDNDSGFIRLVVGNVSTPATWAFRDNGNLTFPGGGFLGQVWGDGVDNELTLKSPTAGGNSAYVALSSANEQNYVEVSDVGIVVGVNFNTEGFKSWTFDTDNNLTVAGNINFGGDASAGPSLNDFASVTSAANFAVTIDSADSAPTWSFETGDVALGEFDDSPLLRTPAGNGSVIYNETLMAILAGNIDAGERSSVRLLEGGVSLLGTTSLDGELSTIIMEVNTGGVGIRAVGDAAPRLSVVGNITGGNILTSGSVTTTGNVTGGNISTAGAVSATGNLSANNISTGNVTATRLQNDANLEIRSNVAGTARIWTFDTIGDFNLPVGGNISGSGYVTAIRLITDPRPLANLSPVSGGRAFVSDGNLVAAGNFGAQIGSGGANTVPVWSDGANWYVG